MALVKLKDAGSIVGLLPEDPPVVVDGLYPVQLDRPAVLVYAGKFESAEGPVTVTAADVKRLVRNHNGVVTRMMAKARGMKGCPPVQLDHSRAARDTVGRVVGALTEGLYETDDGQTVPAVYGTLRILGRENVEKVADGRWIHLSVGADFEVGALAECTITPFPAAAEASMLKAGTKTTEEPREMKNRDKLKKYLMGTKKLSEADAEKELSRLSLDEHKDELSKLEAEDDENDKRLAAESEEKDRKEKEEREAKEKKDKEEKLTAARGKLSQLSAGFKSTVEGSRLAARQGRILTRLSKLRAEAKITPAEVKKIDIAKLAGEPDAAIELVMKTYADREPVVMIGQYGSINGADASAAGKKAKLAQLEAETRANMPLLARTSQGQTNLAGGDPKTAKPNPEKRPGEQDDEDAAQLSAEHDEICKMMDDGKVDEAKKRLKGYMAKCAKANLSAGDFVEANAEETEKQLSALAENVTKMQAQFDELHQLATTLAG